MRALRPALAALMLAAAIPALAGAATMNGLTPISPTRGATVEEGTRPVFTGQVRGRGSVWVRVSTSRRVDDDGLIEDDAAVLPARRRDGRFRARARFYDYPEFWLNTPGTYFWQAHRIACGGAGDCLREGPIVRFTVG